MPCMLPEEVERLQETEVANDWKKLYFSHNRAMGTHSDRDSKHKTCGKLKAEQIPAWRRRDEGKA